VTTPWPAYDSETQTVMCCLCFESKAVQELSKDVDGNLTDVCLVCRQKELQAVLTQVAVILSEEVRIEQSTTQSNSEITQGVVIYSRRCGHVTVKWWEPCSVCEEGKA
jgi:hypothetical protein